LGKVHNEVREDILDADVKQLEATLIPRLRQAGGRPQSGVQSAYPTIKLRINKAEDLTALAGVVDTMVRAGLPLGQESMYDRFGLERPKPGEAILVRSMPRSSRR
jgi:phage gp29-like protein